jgi:arylsulfatase A-like enzyme
MEEEARRGAHRRHLVLATLVALLLVLGHGQAEAARPSIVMILSDDQDLASFAYMPKTKALIEDRGANFANYFVTNSFCCPSRSTILRGQYAQNHRVEGNDWPIGGFGKFQIMGLGQSTVATWLDAAGYRTGFFGKLMNGYRPEADPPLPGWDEWHAVGDGLRNFNYTLNENGKVLAYGDRPEDHLTDVLARKAAAVIRDTPPEEPLFLYVAPYDPHSPAIPAPRHAGKFADLPFPKTPSYDEANVGDKHRWIRELPPLAAWQKQANEQHHRERLRALQAVDDMVETVVAALAETGRLEDTYVVYTSDNGFHMGEHRLFVGKTTAYEEDIRVPFVIRGPGIRPGRTVPQLVLNNDLAPTFAAIGGVAPPAFVDGRSLLPLLAKEEGVPWRKSFLVERRQRETHELVDGAAFDALRSEHYTFIQFDTGERELYDLRRDPWQLDNVAATADRGLVEALAQRMAEIRGCAGDWCRQVEDLPVEPAATPVAQSAEGRAG